MRTNRLSVAACCVVMLLRCGEAPAPPARTETVVTTTQTVTAETRSVAPVSVQQTDAAYVGNVNTHKFHRLSCRYARCKNCTAHYATRDEALAAGFRPCGICDP